MALMEVKVPDIGDFDQVSVIEVLVKVGDTIKAEQSLVTVESDKASMEIPSSHAGVVRELRVALGDAVKQGSVVLVLETAQGAAAPPAAAVVPVAPLTPTGPAAPTAAMAPNASAAAIPAAAHRAAMTPPGAAPVAPAPAAPGARLPHASPSVRRLARTLGVPLNEVRGQGPKGRITPADLEAFVKRVMVGETTTAAQAARAPAASAAAGGAGLDLLPWPKVDFA